MEVNSSLSDKGKQDFLLVLEAKNGNQKAYAELLKKYRDSIYFMLLKMVKNHDDAEDLTIEAFGKAFRNLDLYTPTFAFSTWLFKIASNNGIDFLRSKKTSKQHLSIDYTDEESDSGTPANLNLIANVPDPEENLISQQKEKMLREVVQQLHPDYRDIIILRYFDELSYAEIAQELNIPLGTVKARLFRSRELLTTIMKENNIGKEKF